MAQLRETKRIVIKKWAPKNNHFSECLVCVVEKVKWNEKKQKKLNWNEMKCDKTKIAKNSNKKKIAKK